VAKSKPRSHVGPGLRPVIAPVVARLDYHERLLRDLKRASEIQIARIAQMQVQLDRLIASLKS